MSPFQVVACLTLSTAVMLGCGGGNDADKDRPARTAVSGIVTLKGTPVEGAKVTLHPSQKGNGAFGITDASGKFVLGTFEKGDGAVPGDYKVSITKIEVQAAGSQPAPGDPGYDPNPKEVPPKHLLPEKYADFTKSELTASVTNTPRKDLNFNLE